MDDRLTRRLAELRAERNELVGELLAARPGRIGGTWWGMTLDRIEEVKRKLAELAKSPTTLNQE